MNAEILAFWDDLESKLTPGLIEKSTRRRRIS